MSKNRNALIHLLNIAGMGPIILAGGVHDYFAGMLSVRNRGAQITGLIQEYLGKNTFRIFMVIVTIMLLLLATVFVYTV